MMTTDGAASAGLRPGRPPDSVSAEIDAIDARIEELSRRKSQLAIERDGAAARTTEAMEARIAELDRQMADRLDAAGDMPA